MSLFLSWFINFFINAFIGCSYSSWFQNNYYHGTPEAFFEKMPVIFGGVILIVILSGLYVKALTKKPDSIIEQARKDPSSITDEDKELVIRVIKKITTFTLWLDILSYIGVNGSIFVVKLIKHTLPMDPFRISQVFIHCFSCGFLNAMYTVYVYQATLEKKLKPLHITNFSEKICCTTVVNTLFMFFGTIISFVMVNTSALAYRLFYPNPAKPIVDGYSFFVKNFLCIEAVDLAFILPAVIVIVKVLSKRIKYSSEVISMIGSEGDISKRIDVTMTDDLGVMTSNTNDLMDKLSFIMRELKKQSDNLTESAQVLSKNADNSSEALSKMSSTLNKISTEGDAQREMIINVNEAIDGLKKGSESLAQLVDDQSSAMQQNSDSITQMANNINNVAQMTDEAEKLSDILSSTSETGMQVLKFAKQSIKDIQDSSREVQKFIDVIQNISSQTNLLSMNASIEASHAGEAGKGFAVVAGEIRKLANSSSKSADDIKNKIDEMIAKIDAGTSSIKEADSSFNKINSYVDKNQKLINTISQAMVAQKTNANDNITITNSVRDALIKTNDLAKKQKEYAESVSSIMQNVVTSSETVKEAITEGVSASNNLHEAVKEVVDTALSNKESVSKMEVQMSAFKY